jgi:hypothetical protein
MSTLYKWLLKFVMKIGYKISLPVRELGLDCSINQLPHIKTSLKLVVVNRWPVFTGGR